MAGRIAIVIPRAGTGPVVTPLHSAGVDGYVHRYIPSRLGLSAGADIASLTDIGTASVPLLPTGAGTAKYQVANGVGYAELTSSNDTTANYILQGASTPAYQPQVTIAMVAQVPAAQVRIFEAGSLSVIRATSGQLQASRTNGSGGSVLTSGTNVWAFMLAQVDAASGTLLLRANSTEATAALTSVQMGATPPRMGGNQGAALKVTQVLEGLTWNRILTADERLAVHNAMRTKWSAVLS